MNILLLILFLFSIAMFAGFEVGFYVINPVKLDIQAEREQRSAILLKWFKKHKEHLIISILIGTNLFNYLFSGLLMHSLGNVNETYRVFLSTIIGTACVFLFAEVYPKFLFQTYPDILTYLFAGIIYVFHIIFTPIGLILKLITELFRRIFRIRKSSMVNIYGRKSLVSFIDHVYEMKFIDKSKKDMLYSILQLKECKVKELMIDKKDVISFFSGDKKEKILDVIKSQPYKRYPIIDAEEDYHVIKILNTLSILWNEKSWHSLDELVADLSDPIFIGEDESQLHALQIMQSSSSVMAVVTENGMYTGIITLRDIINGSITKMKDM